MAVNVIMPKQGLQMTEGKIIQWLASEGSVVAKGQALFEVETDKLTITIDSPADGTLLKILAQAGDTVPVSATIAFIGRPGEAVAAAATGAGPSSAEHEASMFVAAPPRRFRMAASPRARMRADARGIDVAVLRGSGPDGLIIERDVLEHTGAAAAVKATHLAQKTASLNNIEIAGIRGTGPAGRVVKNDILRALAEREKGGADRPDVVQHLGRDAVLIPHSSMRAMIAKRMSESLRVSAQANHKIHIDCGELLRLRQQRKKAGAELSLTDVFVKIACAALVRCPFMNSVFTEEGAYVFTSVNIGVAVALDDGLVVPVLKNVEALSLEEIDARLRGLVGRAKSGAMTMDDISGSTFTLTNLGMYDIDSFTAIIQQPENGILALGAVKERPVVRDGSIVARPLMTACLTYDHRAIDGAPAAKFLKTFKDLCENTSLLL